MCGPWAQGVAVTNITSMTRRRKRPTDLDVYLTLGFGSATLAALMSRRPARGRALFLASSVRYTLVGYMYAL